MNNLQTLIDWLKEIQEGKEPSIPFNFHKLIRVLLDEFGAVEAIYRLEQLRDWKKPEREWKKPE